MQSSSTQASPNEDLRLETQRGLVVRVTLSSRSEIVTRFYEGYDRAFVLPNEKEELSGFIECLALNEGDAHQALVKRFGPFRELVLIAETSAGDLIGGANFITFPLANGRLCSNLNYIYVQPQQRRRGYFSSLVAAVDEVARYVFAGQSDARPLVFIEQNDPVCMSREDYARDSERTGLDQIERIAIWAKLGARVVDFAYVQPALSENQEADRGLVYSVLGAGGSSLSACLLRDHLERFFAISVLKGRGLDTSSEAQAQIVELSQRCAAQQQIALLDPARALARLRQREVHGVNSGRLTLRALIEQSREDGWAG
ncbi:MAG TPA: hypothetical protein VHM70_11695 [Polyangiaceae bacterium]|jgi:GNAT superfamily N-acetyltransferase|nr:hypothetical protein [Polyangiaceae bacterium]